MASPVLVTGGTGRLGKLVVARLQDSGCDVRVLAAVLPGHPAGRQILRRRPPGRPGHRACRDRGCSHHPLRDQHEGRRRGNPQPRGSRVPDGFCPPGVCIHRRYRPHRLLGIPKKTKLQAEQIVTESGVPWTILRVTQFYDYCLTMCVAGEPVPRGASAGGLTVQPVDPRDVAGPLVELALGEPVGRAPDMAGPQVSNWTDLLREYLKASHRRRWVLPVRIPGTKAVRNGALLPPPGHTVGSRTWDQFLTTQLRQQATPTA